MVRQVAVGGRGGNDAVSVYDILTIYGVGSARPTYLLTLRRRALEIVVVCSYEEVSMGFRYIHLIIRVLGFKIHLSCIVSVYDTH